MGKRRRKLASQQMRDVNGDINKRGRRNASNRSRDVINFASQPDPEDPCEDEIPNGAGKSARALKKAAARRKGRFRNDERATNKEHKRRNRENVKKRVEKRERDVAAKREQRTNSAFRSDERKRVCESKRSFREDQVYRNNEKIKDCESRRELRADKEYREHEKERDCELKHDLRADENYREQERGRDAAAHVKCRADPKRSCLLKFGTWEKLLSEFQSEIKDGPTHICASCGGLWFAKSMREVTSEFLARTNCSSEHITSILHVKSSDGKYELCGTCFNSAVKNQVPRRNLSNGFGYPDLPPILRNLTSLEERLVSPRIPFMQLRELGVYRQKGLRGNVVNVPNDLDTCAKTLPRNFTDTSTIQVMLMRKMCYKSPYMYETIRPHAVKEAANVLCQSALYKAEGITLCDDWLKNHHSAEAVDFIVEPHDQDMDMNRQDGDQSQETRGDRKNEPNSESDSEDEHPINPGADETLIVVPNNKLIKIAPGEGQRPIGWLRDVNAEQLSFPSIFGGVPRNFKKGIQISLVDIQRSQARMFDRRGVKPVKILYSAKLLQNQCLRDQLQIFLRQKRRTNAVTAGEVKSDEGIEKLVNHDHGFRCLRNIRSSPAFWESQEKKVMAMSRQLGTPTFFVTNSAAETKWSELLIILEKIHHNRTISETEALEMPFQEKAALIRSDPCVCALYFDHRFRCLLNLIINKRNGAFSPLEVTDFYNKVEFAHRGSAHNHGMYWIKDAPKYDREDETSITACIKFIDQHISCMRNGDKELEKAVGFQLHKHTHTCRRRTRNGKFKCRFNLPLPPMPETMILKPLLGEEQELEKAMENYDKIQTRLNEMGRQFTEDINIDQFIQSLGLTKESYFLAIRSSIKRDKIFLRRKTCDIFINAYNPKILVPWNANMDIQFILDPYACVKYCISYLTKSCGGMSKLMRQLEKETRSKPLPDRLRAISNSFLNAVEISAQEAAYLVLGLSLTNSSREDTFINTGPQEERVSLLRPKEELEALDESSQDIFVHGLLDRYPFRPKELENVCLAEFAAMYTFTKRSSNNGALKLLDGSGFLTKRMRARVIRYRRYNLHQDPGNYYREQLLLYAPYRKEWNCNEFTFMDLFERNAVILITNRNQFDPNHGHAGPEDMVDQIQLELSAQNCDDPVEMSPDYETDIFDNISNSKQVKRFEFLNPPKLIPDSEYLQRIRTLNRKQRKYFMNLVHKIKTKKPPTCDFISGQAGVGKSVLITAIVQWVIRFATKEGGFDLNSLPILVCAPTGKAAFNIDAITLHCALRLPPNEFFDRMADLSEEVCNSLRVKFKNLMVMIIDEISMVSLVKFHQINQRLQQIFNNRLPFGGVRMIVVGDFYQIRPCFGQFVFEVPRNVQFGFIFGNSLWGNFRMYQLTEIMRQKTALRFAQALNNMGKGEMTSEDIALIRSREVSNGLKPPENSIHLFWTNKECSEYNEYAHGLLSSAFAISIAQDTIQGKISEKEKEKFLAYVKQLPTKDTDGLPYSVRLQVGALYMICTNIDVSDGLFNGSTGYLQHIEQSTTADGLRMPTKIYIQFENPVVGMKARANAPRSNSVDQNWTPIGLLPKPLNKIGYHQGITVTRKQIPVVPANGITITKSQGSSEHNVVLHVRRRLARDQVYVGSSRAFTLEGFFIEGEFQPPGRPPPYLTEEMRRLQDDPLQLSLRYMDDEPDDRTRLIFQNVQSLNAHYPDLICDYSFVESNIIALVEPWTLARDVYDFGRYNHVYREDCQGIRSSYGSLVASASELDNYGFQSTKSGPSAHFSFSIWSTGNVACCMIYRSPSSVSTEFLRSLEDKLIMFGSTHTVIFGDFNLDPNNDKRLLTLFAKYRYKFLLSAGTPSTDGGTQIDLCFANFMEADAWYYESIYSYHKPICITWPSEDKNLTLWKVKDLEAGMSQLALREPSTDIIDASDKMEVDSREASTPESFKTDQLKYPDLPVVTAVNAMKRHWRVSGLSLSLRDLKTLPTRIPKMEADALTEASRYKVKNELTNEDEERFDEFVQGQLTDTIIDACLRVLIASHPSSRAYDVGLVQLVTTGALQLQADQDEWQNLETVFFPIHNEVRMHWMLLVLKPKENRILFFDPAGAFSPGVEANILAEAIRNILNDQDITIETPRKSEQKDDSSCGVFVIKYVARILARSDLLPNFNSADFRQHLLLQLWMHSEEYLQALN